MLGFQAGVTVSVEETIEAFNRVFGGGGQFGNATQLLAETLQGQVSLVQDAYFQFRRTVSEQFFSFLTQQIRNLVGDFKDNDAALQALAASVGRRLANAFRSIETAGRFVVENFQRISAAIQAIIAFKFAGIIGGMVAALAHMVIGLRAAATGATLFGTALRLNPIGAIITAVQLAVGAFANLLPTLAAKACKAASLSLKSPTRFLICWVRKEKNCSETVLLNWK